MIVNQNDYTISACGSLVLISIWFANATENVSIFYGTKKKDKNIWIWSIWILDLSFKDGIKKYIQNHSDKKKKFKSCNFMIGKFNFVS